MDTNSPLYLAGVAAGKQAEQRRIQSIILTERARVLKEKAAALDAYASCLEELAALESPAEMVNENNVLTLPLRR